jgi:predicted acyltransferase
MSETANGAPSSHVGDVENRKTTSQRLESLDQFRGYTVAGMFLVNFLGSYVLVTGQFPNLKHHNTFCSYADTIMPQFFFAVGFGFRLTLLKRLQTEGVWSAYSRVVQRIFGLLLIAIFVHGLDGEYKSWSDLTATGWVNVLAAAFKRNYFQTLTHIALASLWVVPVIAAGMRWRLVYFLGSGALHLVVSYLGYYQWVHEYRGIDGGWLGFVSWGMVVLAGSFAYDFVYPQAPYDRVNPTSLTLSSSASGSLPRAKFRLAIRRLLLWGVVLMVVGYGLSCLNRITPPNDELASEKWMKIFNTPPFVLPTEPINLWTMSQRAGSVSYMTFSAGFCMVLFAVCLQLADVWGIRLGIFRTLGTNALAGYVIHVWVNETIEPFFPKDSPILYAFFGFAFSFLMCYLILRSFEKQKIFFRI